MTDAVAAEPAPAGPPPEAGPRHAPAAIAVAAVVLAVLAGTLNDVGFAWDEAFVVERVDRLREWFARVGGDANPPRAWAPRSSNLEPRPVPLGRSPWGRDSVRFFWPFAREDPNNHPPFYALLSLAGAAATGRVLPPPACYRFGTAALFAATIGALYAFMARHYGRAAGLMAALGLAAMPRVFAHAHLATTDAPVLCLWLLAALGFDRAVAVRSGWGRPALLGLAWGCAAGTKLTGWFVPVPLLAWALIYRDARAFRVLLIGGAVAALTLFAMIPPWWPDPAGGLRSFLAANLGRRTGSPIPTLFLGRLYPFSLPWYNTLVWTAVVTPPLTLALGLAGAARVAGGRLRDRTGTLLLLCWGFLMALRALPNAPGHDGERQFLPAFGFLACLAGVGLAAIPGRIRRPNLARAATGAVLAGVVAAGSWSTARFHPVQLSYYNRLAGGLPGAARLGLEPTYYWDALTPRARAWLNAHTGPGRSVAFLYPVIPFEYLHHWGLLSPEPIPDRAHPPQWLAAQNRPGLMQGYGALALQADLFAHARPAYVEVADVAPDVPLVAVYAIADVVEAEQRLARREAGAKENPGRARSDPAGPGFHPPEASTRPGTP